MTSRMASSAPGSGPWETGQAQNQFSPGAKQGFSFRFQCSRWEASQEGLRDSQAPGVRCTIKNENSPGMQVSSRARRCQDSGSSELPVLRGGSGLHRWSPAPVLVSTYMICDYLDFLSVWPQKSRRHTELRRAKSTASHLESTVSADANNQLNVRAHVPTCACMCVRA